MNIGENSQTGELTLAELDEVTGGNVALSGGPIVGDIAKIAYEVVQPCLGGVIMLANGLLHPYLDCPY